jgi:hypothetical protein
MQACRFQNGIVDVGRSKARRVHVTVLGQGVPLCEVFLLSKQPPKLVIRLKYTMSLWQSGAQWNRQ